MLAPKYRFRVDWGALDVGAFTVGTSTVGGADAIVADDAGFAGTFSSPYADVAGDVLLGKIQRKIGADGICEGTLDLTLTDTWPGKYNAKNPGVLANYCGNPSFEVDVTTNRGSSYYGSISPAPAAPTFAQVADAMPGFGAHSCEETAVVTAYTSGNFEMSLFSAASSGAGLSYPCVPGELIAAHGNGKWVSGPQAPISLSLSLRWLKADGSYNGETRVGLVNNPAAGQWYELAGQAAAPAGTAYAHCYLYFNVLGPVALGTYKARFDALLHAPALALPAGVTYVDGDSDMCRWAGAAGASASYYGAPLYGEIRPGLRVEGQVSFDGGGTWNGIYVGWLNETESEPDYGSSQARINFTDMAYLSRPIPAIASTGPITVAAALDLVHDAVGWLGARDFRSDTMLSDFSTDGSGTGRDAVAEIIKVDLGFYYVSRDFTATYVDRYEYARRASGAAVQSMGASVPGVALSTIVNLATATGPSGTPQTYEDAHSNTLYGPLPDPLGNVQSDWFRDDAAALGNAQWRVITQKDPTSPYWQFQPLPADDATLADCILTDVLDVVTVEPVGLPAEDQQAQWVIHDFGGGQAHVVTWRLREKPAVAPLLVGTGTVGSTDVVAPG